MKTKQLNQLLKLAKRNMATLAKQRTQLEIAEQIGKELEQALEAAITANQSGTVAAAAAPNKPRKA